MKTSFERGVATTVFVVICWFFFCRAVACAQIYPEIPMLVSEKRAKIPASFRVKKDSQGKPKGLEVVELDQGIYPEASYTFNDRGRMVTRKFAPGDVISRFDGQAVNSTFDLFNMLRNQGNYQVEVTARGQRISASMNARPVTSPKLFNPVPKKGARAFVLHIVDNKDPKIGDKIQTNVNAMKTLFTRNVEKKRLAEYILISEFYYEKGERLMQPPDRRCTALNILWTINKLPITPNDTLFVYYQGHGGYSAKKQHWENDTSAGHFFQLEGNDLFRSALVRLMLAKNARMTILISDCCNVRSAFETDYKSRRQTAMYNITGWTKLESLLFCHAGFIDVTSASRGNMSWCTQEYGSWFTYSFLSTMQGGGSGLEGSWPLCWADVKENSASFYESQRKLFMDNKNVSKALKRQKLMPAHEYQLDVERQFPPDPPGQRQIPKLSTSVWFIPTNK